MSANATRQGASEKNPVLRCGLDEVGVQIASHGLDPVNQNPEETEDQWPRIASQLASSLAA